LKLNTMDSGFLFGLYSWKEISFFKVLTFASFLLPLPQPCQVTSTTCSHNLPRCWLIVEQIESEHLEVNWLDTHICTQYRWLLLTPTSQQRLLIWLLALLCPTASSPIFPHPWHLSGTCTCSLHP
jgi:hypothetical protein